MANRLTVDVSAPHRDPDEVAVVTGGKKITGWESVSVTLRAEGFPNSFSVSLSDPPGTTVFAVEGDDCEIYLGDDLVITGYIDAAPEGADPLSHTLLISGRGKTADIADCSAEWPGGLINASTVEDLISRIAATYGLTVDMKAPPGKGTGIIPFALNYGEGAADLVQRVARSAGYMVYESPKGEVVLAQSGTAKAASSIMYGENVERYLVTNDMSERYSDIVCVRYAQNVNADITGPDDAFFFGAVKDPGVKRHRLLYLTMEQGTDPQNFTEQKAKWEMARRIARSCTVHVTVDSWRDKGGGLWLPNTLVDVDVPGLRLEDKTLCISEATFRRNDQEGTVADLVLMPPQAFTPEPFQLITTNTTGINQVSGS